MMINKILNNEDYLNALREVERLWDSEDPIDIINLDTIAAQIEEYESVELKRLLPPPYNK